MEKTQQLHCSDFHRDEELYLLLDLKTLQLRGQKEMFCMLWPQVLLRERQGRSRPKAYSVSVCARRRHSSLHLFS